jgi:hypothetical protein
MLVTAALSVLVAAMLLLAQVAYATSNYAISNSEYSFVDSSGMTNIVGIFKNTGDTSISVTLALDIVDKDGQKSVLQEIPYGRVISPAKDAPFKFKLPAQSSPVGTPYVIDLKEIEQPYYDMLVFDYSNMAVGEEKMLVGTVRNNGPFEFRNVSVFASVHDEKMHHLDTVRSNVIEVLLPGEVAEFSATPDPTVKSQVYYYSCAGFDADNPITTLPAGDGTFIPYNLTTVAKVSSFRYDDETDSIQFGIKHYNPKGGPASLQVPQIFENQTLTVFLDGQAYSDTSVKLDGRTVHLDFFVPAGDHEVQIQGVRTIPEFPFVVLALALVMAAAIAFARLKAAFKIS